MYTEPVSKRDVPLNDTAIEAIRDLRSEFYFGEDIPLVCDQSLTSGQPGSTPARSTSASGITRS